MKFDNLGFIQMEQSEFPGSVGDSCAETSRFITLSALVGKSTFIDLKPFITSAGVVRYPSPPSPWGPYDTSDDQVMPLIAATKITGKYNAWVMNDLKVADYKTGNGQIIHPLTFTQLTRSQDSWWSCLFDIFLLFQALIFLLPYHWDDGKEWFVKSTDSSADYLNFINALAFAKIQKSFGLFCKLAIKIIPQDDCLRMVTAYYKPEPNNEMILDLYAEALKVIYA